MASFRPANHSLADQTVILLYSDGLAERRTESLGSGLDRLRAATHQALERDDDPDQLVEDLLRITVDPSRTEDDIVLVCMRYRPKSRASVAASG